MSHKDPQSLEPWRAVLREGDPARAEPGLDPLEVERMRRTVLAARPEPRRRHAVTPVWAASLAAAALILAIGLVRTIRVEETTPAVALSGPSPAPAAPAPPPARPVPPRPTPPPAVSSLAPRPEVRVARLPEPEPSELDAEPDPGLVEEVVLSASLDSAAADGTAGAQPRQVQFSTPGGTRIIWMLAPEESTTEESHE
jgi:hypothetical protein